MKDKKKEPTQDKDAHLKALKAKHGPITVAYVSDPKADEPIEVEFVFRKPNFSEGSAASAMQDRDPLGSIQLIAKTCLVAGPEELLDELDTISNLAPVINSLVDTFRVRVKKL